MSDNNLSEGNSNEKVVNTDSPFSDPLQDENILLPELSLTWIEDLLFESESELE